MECPNCYRQTGSTGRIFCSRKCADAYRHKVRRLLDKAKNQEEHVRLWQKYYRYHMPIDGLKEIVCKGCGVKFTPKTRKQIFCTKACGTKWRNRNVYKHRYSVEHTSSCPRNYINALLSQKNRRKNLSIDYVMGIYESQEGKCALSGELMTYVRGQGNVPTNISIDRIDSSRGYVEGNIQLVCRAVNMIKNEWSQEDLISFCRKIIEVDEQKRKQEE